MTSPRPRLIARAFMQNSASDRIPVGREINGSRHPGSHLLGCSQYSKTLCAKLQASPRGQGRFWQKDQPGGLSAIRLRRRDTEAPGQSVFAKRSAAPQRPHLLRLGTGEASVREDAGVSPAGLLSGVRKRAGRPIVAEPLGARHNLHEGSEQGRALSGAERANGQVHVARQGRLQRLTL